MARFEAVAITDERDSCDCCGRVGLKRVVVLDDSEAGDFVYYGTTCAARALRINTARPAGQIEKSVVARVEAASKDRRRALGEEFKDAADSLAEALDWDYRPSNSIDRFRSGWLRNAAPKVAERFADSEAGELLDRLIELDGSLRNS